MIGVGIGGCTQDFSEDRCAASNGRFHFLEHEDTRSFGEHETVAVAVEGSRHVVRRHRGHVRETSDAGGGHDGFGRTGNHGIAEAGHDESVGVTD
ncbi:unannotated protein [freshwater metagenome]|uniref:Unannotated protein n=1 Tax=freshwater metagenome TaxID=449393 RepID=A0A6J6EMW1_9ZZZZ